MSTELKDLLMRIAAGELSPDEAERQVADLLAAERAASAGQPGAGDAGCAVPASVDPGTPGGDAPTGDGEPADTGPEALADLSGATPVGEGHPGTAGSDAAPGGSMVRPRRVVVRADRVRLTVLADPEITGVAVDGPHRVREDAGTWRVDVGPGVEVEAGSDEFRMTDPALPGWLRWIPGLAAGRRVVVRVGRDLPLELDLVAGGAEVRGLHAPLTARVSSGSLGVREHQGTVDVAAVTSSVELDVRLTEGESRVVAELASAVVRLRPGSDVRVVGTAELGEVAIRGGWPAVEPGSAAGEALGAAGQAGSAARAVGSDDGAVGDGRTAVVGAGTGLLRVSARLGSAQVFLP